MALVHKRLEIDESRTGRLDRVVQHLTGRSRRELRGLFDHDCVQLNGQTTQAANLAVGPGDVVEIRYDKDQRYHEKPRARRDVRYRLVFEDEHVIVVDKAAFVLSVPTEKGETNTLVHALFQHVNKGRHGRRRVEVVHRLDRGASGLLVFAKTEAAAENLREQFKAHSPAREYLALLAGEVAKPEGTIRSYLETDANLNRFSSQPGKGELAVTHYVVEKVAHDATLVRVWLETGRRNQIRVHFAEAGHPVLGDPRYQKKRAQHPRWTARWMALHAVILGFRHPVTGAEMKFQTKMPAEFVRFLRPGPRLDEPRPPRRRA